MAHELPSALWIELEFVEQLAEQLSAAAAKEEERLAAADAMCASLTGSGAVASNLAKVGAQLGAFVADFEGFCSWTARARMEGTLLPSARATLPLSFVTQRGHAEMKAAAEAEARAKATSEKKTMSRASLDRLTDFAQAPAA